MASGPAPPGHGQGDPLAIRERIAGAVLRLAPRAARSPVPGLEAVRVRAGAWNRDEEAG